MTQIPEQNPLTPEQAFAQLQEWYAAKAALAAAQAEEVLTRKRLAAFYFPHPQEGTNRLDLGGGFDLKVDHKINRSVDEAALDSVKAGDIKRLKLPMDELFVYKPTLSTTAYRKLNKEQTAFVDALLDIKEGTPAMSIVANADTAGAAAHAAAAEAAEAPAYDISMREDTTEVGQYFKDPNGDWWLLGEEEWSAVENADTVAALEAQLAPAPAKKTRKPRAKK